MWKHAQAVSTDFASPVPKPDLHLPQKMRRNRWRPLERTTWYICALADGYWPLIDSDVESMGAQGLVEAAGLRRKQNWALILSVGESEVIYETVIAVRYPELDADTPRHVAFGNYG